MKKIAFMLSLLTPLVMGGVNVYNVELTGEDTSARGLATVVVNADAAQLSITLTHNVEGATAAVIHNDNGDVSYSLESAAKVIQTNWDVADVDIAAAAEAGLTISVLSETYPEGAIFAKLDDAEDAVEYEVTVTNLTSGQPFSPVMVVSHDAATSLYAVGHAAPDALIPLVEDGINDDMTAYAMSLGGVFHVNNGTGPIPPGGSATITVCGTTTASRISVLSMLVNTNDAFFALNGFKAPPAPYAFKNAGPLTPTLTALANVYDAGTEINNESCDYVPGPFCNSLLVRDPENGVILAHNGIHDVFHLESAVHDWRGPVAHISIKRAD